MNRFRANGHYSAPDPAAERGKGSRAMLDLSKRTIPDHSDDLRRAEGHVAEARRIVQTQKGRILRLKAASVDTSDAECTLRVFETNLRRFEEHRDILKATESTVY